MRLDFGRIADAARFRQDLGCGRISGLVINITNRKDSDIKYVRIIPMVLVLVQNEIASTFHSRRVSKKTRGIGVGTQRNTRESPDILDKNLRYSTKLGAEEH